MSEGVTICGHAGKKFLDYIVVSGPALEAGGLLGSVTPEALMQLLLSTSQLEFKLKRLFQGLLDSKQDKWASCKPIVGLQIVAPATFKSDEDFFGKICARKFDES